METNGTPPKQHIPRLSNGKPVIFGFIEDAEKGPVLITNPNLPLSMAIHLARQCAESFDLQWRQMVEQRMNELKTAPTLYSLNGGKLA